MRICYLAQFFNRPDEAGAGRHYAFATEWARLGHEVTVITGQQNYRTGLNESSSLRPRVETIDGVRVVESDKREEGFLCSFVFRSGETYGLYSDRDFVGRVRSLGAICRIYQRGDARMDRVTHEDVEALRQHHPHFGAMVVFPDITKHDVRRVAECGERLPSGITRFLVPRRVLGFNLQLALLKSNLPLEDKRAWLGEAIQKKIADHKVRFYQEPIFVFDD